jgi:hypothetical protein
MPSDCPCKGCQKRWVDIVNIKTCHSTCREYIEWCEMDLQRKSKHKAEVQQRKDAIAQLINDIHKSSNKRRR